MINMKLILVAVLMLSSVSFAAELPQYNSISEFVQTEVQEQNDYVSKHEKGTAQVNDSWYLNLIRLRIMAIIGLEVPIFASFSLIPKMEFRWKRKTPAGYVDYAL